MKRKSLIVTILLVVIVLITLGVTYAFFNYTRTGSPNTIRVGRIAFTTNQTKTINLTNVFPIASSSVGTDTDNVGEVEVTITGDTDYFGGIEYLISSDNTNIYTTSGKAVPVSLDITVTNLGTENANYFTARESQDTTMYKKLTQDTIVGDQMLLVGYIKPNTTSGTAEGVNGKITIKAYLDNDKIAISDTYDGTESDNNGTTNEWVDNRTILTTDEWNALQSSGISFQIKVEANEGIWVIGSLEDIMKRNAVMDNIQSEFVTASTGIDFSQISSDTNGKGLYIRSGTENDAYPIVYYRGDVEDNNVLFNNKCWKAVRTTDTGGVKLIYNGELSHGKRILELSDYGTIISNTGNYTFDSTTNSWNNSMINDTELEMSFHLSPGTYVVELSGIVTAPDTSETDAELEILLNEEFMFEAYGDPWWYGDGIMFTINILEIENSNDVVKIYMEGFDNTETYPTNVSVKFYKVDDSLVVGCDNKGDATHIANTAFNTNTNALAYVGYMYGTVYTPSYGNWKSGARFGSGFTWDGTNYTLIDDSRTSPDASHHYSCNLTTTNGSCTSIRYVFMVKFGEIAYLTLTGGDGIEDAMTKSYLNITNSNAKNTIETWFSNNMMDYLNKIEDTIYCNDRSISDLRGFDPTLGNPNDFYSARVLYSSNNRLWEVFTPELRCLNKNDAFTWKNNVGNQKLTYPIGMLSSDEYMLSGNASSKHNINNYLNSGGEEFSMSPDAFHENPTSNSITFISYIIGNEGFDMDGANVSRNYFGLRPVISIKPGQLITKGIGTVSDPYVIE